MFTRKTLLQLGIALIAAAVIMAVSFRVPIVGVVLLGVAPTVLLIGVATLATGTVPTKDAWVRGIVFLCAILLLGLNTYVIALVQPLSKTVADFPESPLRLTPASWVKLDSNVERLAGRVYPLRGPAISCEYFMCINFRGIFMPRPDVPSEYWVETVEDEFFKLGISLSGDGPPAGFMKILDTAIGACRRRVQIRLLDADKSVVGTLSEDYRVCLPGAPPDGSKVGLFDYLRLSNPLSHFVSAAAGRSHDQPLGMFLRRTLWVDEATSGGTHVINVQINAAMPTPAEPVLDSLVSMQAIRKSWGKEKCGALMERRDIERGMQLMDPTYRKLRLDDVPVRFMRDGNGRLVGYTASSEVRLICTNDAIHYLVTSPLPGGSEQLQIFRFNRDGVLSQLIVASIEKPAGEQVEPDLSSIEDDGTSIDFTLWYFKPDDDFVTRRQQVTSLYDADRQH